MNKVDIQLLYIYNIFIKFNLNNKAMQITYNLD